MKATRDPKRIRKAIADHDCQGMEAKGIVRRVRKVGNFHLFSASITRDAAQHRLMDDLLTLFGGRSQLLMAHLIKGGKLSLADVKEAEKMLRQLSSKEKQP